MSTPLIVHGQGVLLFDTKVACTLQFLNSDKSDGLLVDLSPTEFTVTRMANKDVYRSQGVSSGLTSKSGAYYWFSLDSQNQRFLAGVGEPRLETVCYTYQFNPSEANKAFLESLTSFVTPGYVRTLRLLKDPVTAPVPLVVKSIDELTMDDVASAAYLPNAALSSAAQSLYNCVAGQKFVLDTPDFPEFSKAIEYSIKTPGLWCNKRLLEKANEFGKAEPLETYLRITLGQNNGESPGIPYVMEIWPVGHYSPVHNHGGANAVIRVLHGSIHVRLFPFLSADGVDPFATKDFNKGDITWISSTLNSVHQLKNLDTNKATCVTIQCYLYDKIDAAHYDYFDYLDTKSVKKQYEPDSDMEFIAFKELMWKEWHSRPLFRCLTH